LQGFHTDECDELWLINRRVHLVGMDHNTTPMDQLKAILKAVCLDETITEERGLDVYTAFTDFMVHADSTRLKQLYKDMKKKIESVDNRLILAYWKKDRIKFAASAYMYVVAPWLDNNRLLGWLLKLVDNTLRALTLGTTLRISDIKGICNYASHHKTTMEYVNMTAYVLKLSDEAFYGLADYGDFIEVIMNTDSMYYTDSDMTDDDNYDNNNMLVIKQQ
jgi:hypothetical protein